MFVHGSVISLCILITSIVSVFFAYRLTLLVSRKFDLTHILFLFMVYYVVFAYIGSVILNVWYTSYGKMYLVYQNKDILLKIWFTTTAGLFFLPLIVYMLTELQFTFYLKKKNVINISVGRMRFFEKNLSILFIFLGIFVLYLYSKKLNGLPLVSWLKNPSLQQALLRSEATNDFQGHMWRYLVFYQTIPIMIFTILQFYRKNGLLNFFLIFYLCFVSIMTFQKRPLLNFIILNILIYLKKGKKISLRTYFTLLSIFFVLIVVMYIFFMNASGGVFHILGGAFGRIFLGQIIPFYWYFQYVEVNGFLLGTSFPNPAGIFPFEHTRITVDIMNLYRQNAHISTAVVGSMPTVFMADWYVNFGFIGIVLSFILFSFLLSLILISLRRLKKNNPNKTEIVSALEVYLTFYFTEYSGTSYTGIIFDMDLIIPVFICVLFLLLDNTTKYGSQYKFITK